MDSLKYVPDKLFILFFTVRNITAAAAAVRSSLPCHIIHPRSASFEGRTHQQPELSHGASLVAAPQTSN